jgi:hypothetical protein
VETRVNVKAQAMLNAARYIEETYGREVVAGILAGCSPAVRERCAAGIAIEWHPLEELTEFLVAVERALPDRAIGEKLGAAGARANTRGVMIQVAMLLARPENVIRRAARMWRQFNDAGELTLRKASDRAVEVEITGIPQTPRVFCDTVTGWARELVVSAGGRNAAAKHIECRTSRGTRCVWLASWSGILP